MAERKTFLLSQALLLSGAFLFFATMAQKTPPFARVLGLLS